MATAISSINREGRAMTSRRDTPFWKQKKTERRRKTSFHVFLLMPKTRKTKSTRWWSTDIMCASCAAAREHTAASRVQELKMSTHICTFQWWKVTKYIHFTGFLHMPLLFLSISTFCCSVLILQRTYPTVTVTFQITHKTHCQLLSMIDCFRLNWAAVHEDVNISHIYNITALNTVWSPPGAKKLTLTFDTLCFILFTVVLYFYILS